LISDLTEKDIFKALVEIGGREKRVLHDTTEMHMRQLGTGREARTTYKLVYFVSGQINRNRLGVSQRIPFLADRKPDIVGGRGPGIHRLVRDDVMPVREVAGIILRKQRPHSDNELRSVSREK